MVNTDSISGRHRGSGGGPTLLHAVPQFWSKRVYARIHVLEFLKDEVRSTDGTNTIVDAPTWHLVRDSKTADIGLSTDLGRGKRTTLLPLRLRAVRLERSP